MSSSIAAVQSPEIVMVPFNKLRESPRNVRADLPKHDVRSLAASIASVGLLNNLVVSKSRQHFEVEAGARRLAALRSLVAQGSWGEKQPVPCIVIEKTQGVAVSLTENVQREAMHFVSEFRAFARLVKEGQSIEDVAAKFGVTPIVVSRRLRLASVSPRLLDDAMTGSVSLAQLMALAVSDDHAEQEAAFYNSDDWARQPAQLRRLLTHDEVDAKKDRVACFAFAEYVAAGGALRKDLFSDDEGAGWITDSALLERVALGKLEALADPVRREGWKWVEVATRPMHGVQGYGRLPRERHSPSADQSARLAVIRARRTAVEAELEAPLESDAGEGVEALESEVSQLDCEEEVIEDSLLIESERLRCFAGAVIALNYDGEAEITRGLVRAEDRREVFEARSDRFETDDENGEGDDADARGYVGSVCAVSRSAVLTEGLSGALVSRLSAHRTVALQRALQAQPQVAMLALLDALVAGVLMDRYDKPLGHCIGVQGRVFTPTLPVIEEALATSETWVQLKNERALWRERIPTDAAERVTFLTGLDAQEREQLFAVCIAASLSAIVSHAGDRWPAVALARLANLDMSATWQANATEYFGHLTKKAIIEAVREFAPREGGRLSSMKKADLACEAERLVQGTGWLPLCMRSAEAEAAIGSQAS